MTQEVPDLIAAPVVALQEREQQTGLDKDHDCETDKDRRAESGQECLRVEDHDNAHSVVADADSGVGVRHPRRSGESSAPPIPERLSPVHRTHAGLRELPSASHPLHQVVLSP